jgi:hypothetical protein
MGPKIRKQGNPEFLSKLWESAGHLSLECSSIHFVIFRGTEIFSTDPEEFPSAFRAEMRAWRWGTTTTGSLQIIFLAAFRTTVSFHLLSYHAPVH